MEKISRDAKLEQRMDAYLKGDFNQEQRMHLLHDIADHPLYLELLETELLIKIIVKYRLYNLVPDDQQEETLPINNAPSEYF